MLIPVSTVGKGGGGAQISRDPLVLHPDIRFGVYPVYARLFYFFDTAFFDTALSEGIISNGDGKAKISILPIPVTAICFS